MRCSDGLKTSRRRREVRMGAARDCARAFQWIGRAATRLVVAEQTRTQSAPQPMQLLSYFVRPVVLMMILSCGARQTPTAGPCMSDRECQGDRICHEGRCRFLEEVQREVSHSHDEVDAGADLPPNDVDSGADAQPVAFVDQPMFMGGPKHDGRSASAGPSTTPSVGWVHRTRARIFASPVVASDGTVYVGSLDHSVSALSADGTLRWRYTAGDKVYATPAVAGKALFVRTKGHLYRIEKGGGKPNS